MANLTNFVSHQDFFDVQDDFDYIAWRDENFDLLVRFNVVPETKPFGLVKNYFITSIVVNSVRYGKHGFPLDSVQSVISFLKPKSVSYLQSLPDGVQGTFVCSKVFSFNGCKLIVSEYHYRELVNYFDLKIIVGEFFKSNQSNGIWGQLLLPPESWSKAENYRLG